MRLPLVHKCTLYTCFITVTVKRRSPRGLHRIQLIRPFCRGLAVPLGMAFKRRQRARSRLSIRSDDEVVDYSALLAGGNRVARQDWFYNEHGSSGPRNFHHPWIGEIHPRACPDSCTWADITGEVGIPLDMTCRLTNCTAPYESLLGCATSASGHGSSDQGEQFQSSSFSMSGHSFQDAASIVICD